LRSTDELSFSRSFRGKGICGTYLTKKLLNPQGKEKRFAFQIPTGVRIVLDMATPRRRSQPRQRSLFVAISIAIADENAIIRRGLQALFDSEPDFKVVGVVSDGSEALRLAQQMKPDVLVVDLMMPGLGGLGALCFLRGHAPQTSIVVLSMYHSSEFVSQALKNGAAGYVLKSGPEEDLMRAVREAAEGRRCLCPPAAKETGGSYAHKSKTQPFDPHQTLTHRQRQVLQLTAKGKTSAQSAAALHISPRTVENHRAMLMERLGLDNHTDLIRHAIRHGLIPLDNNGG
jgi:two-component system, NarL family, response regulator NreC